MNAIDKYRKEDNKKSRALIISSLILILTLILSTIISFFLELDNIAEKIITGVFSLLTVTTPVLIREFFIKKEENKSNIISPPFINKKEKDGLDIFLFGLSGTGKTSFIQRLFVFDTSPLMSTHEFDYYQIDVPLKLKNLKNNKTVRVKIADYRGQNVHQFIKGAENNFHIDAIIFLADVAPAYGKDGRKLATKDVIELMSNNFEEEFINRIDMNRYKYLSEYLIQLVFSSASSDYLKSVRFVVNKVDILEKLQEKGVIDSEINLESYIKELYKEPIMHIEKFCQNNDIEDFKVAITSVTNSTGIREILSELLRKFAY